MASSLIPLLLAQDSNDGLILCINVAVTLGVGATLLCFVLDVRKKLAAVLDKAEQSGGSQD